jgi:hypothetical protein
MTKKGSIKGPEQSIDAGFATIVKKELFAELAVHASPCRDLEVPLLATR